MGQDRCCRSIQELPPSFKVINLKNMSTKLKENVKNPYCIEGRTVRF
jgi:hypothetical protein